MRKENKALDSHIVTEGELPKVDNNFHKMSPNNQDLNIRVRSLKRNLLNYHKTQNIHKINQKDQMKKVMIKVNNKAIRVLTVKDH